MKSATATRQNNRNSSTKITKNDPYKSSRVKPHKCGNPHFVVVTVDTQVAAITRLEKMARRHRMPLDMLFSCALGMIAFHGEEMLKEVFAGADRNRAIARRHGGQG